jgi:OOP family OmpA-OmpF porin
MRPQHINSRGCRFFAALGLLVCLTLFAPNATADDGPGDIHLFRPALFSGSLMAVERVEQAPKYRPTVGILFNFASKPLKLSWTDKSGTNSYKDEAVLDWAMIFHLQARMALGWGLELALDAPMLRHGLSSPGRGLIKETRATTNLEPAETSPLDMRVGLKFNAINTDSFGLAVAVEGWLPFGNEEVFAGQGSASVEPKLIAAAKLGMISVAANVGYRVRERRMLWQGKPEDATSQLVYGSDDELTFAVGVAARVTRWLELAVEAYGVVPVAAGDLDIKRSRILPAGDPGCPAGTPAGAPCQLDETVKVDVPNSATMELIGSAAFRLGGGFTARLGGGLALVGDERKANYRVLLGLGWELTGDSSGDKDGDGIPDERDQCPTQPEDVDGVDDDDGCPDLDMDGDGVDDKSDRCPGKPEDLDGFKDGDGCPDPDNDGDGIPDALDKCPNKAEDKDGFDDGDGCPEPDNDGDGIEDKKDACPNEPETRNGYLDSDGCPDSAPSDIFPDVKP